MYSERGVVLIKQLKATVGIRVHYIYEVRSLVLAVVPGFRLSLHDCLQRPARRSARNGERNRD